MKTEYTVAPLDEHPDRTRLLPGVLEWVLEAGNPYLEWFFGSPDNARSALAHWIERDSSEVSSRNVQLVATGNGEVIGGFIAMDGKTLRAARSADTVALAARCTAAEKAALFDKMRASRMLFRAPEPHEYYLSKMGVLPSIRGQGHGRAVVEAYLSAGRNKGLDVFSLDVARNNSSARRLYESVGFETIAESEVQETTLAYLSMVRKNRSG